jgi:aryl-alcohol dehydrogenase-like predicted oxidoreductase
MDSLDRRRFLGTSAALAATTGALGTATADDAAAATTEVPRPPATKLGNTGITMSRLGQGTGVHGGNRQSNQTRMGFDELVSLFKHSYERGITFFDLADLYGTHLYFREALRTIPRDEVTILTKVWWRYDGDEKKTSEPHRRQIVNSTIERFRHELTTDHLDMVLLHCLMDADWAAKMTPYTDALQEHKSKGRIKALGVSCHDFGALKTAAALPWVDVILARINPQSVKMDASTDEVVPVLLQAKQNGKAIIGMKIFGEGTLVDQRDACMKFAQGLDFLDAMTIGFEKPEHVDDTLRLMAKYPAAAS